MVLWLFCDGEGDRERQADRECAHARLAGQ